MNPFCPRSEHLNRRAFLKGTLVTAGGLALPNWGGLFRSQTVAAEAARRGKRCILLWMNGGASQIDTFDMKPGRSTGGPPAGRRVPAADRPSGGWAQAVALSPDARQALVSERVPLVFDSGRHAGVRLWDVAAGKPQRDLQADFKGMFLSAAAYSPDGKLLVLGRGGEVDGQNGKVFLVDPATGKKLRELSPGHEYGVTDLAFHPDGVHLASAGRDTVMRVWKTPEG